MLLDTQDHQRGIVDYLLAPTSRSPSCIKGPYDDSQHDHKILSLPDCIQYLEISVDETAGHQDISEDSLMRARLHRDVLETVSSRR
jgi:hypothetical protein